MEVAVLCLQSCFLLVSLNCRTVHKNQHFGSLEGAEGHAMRPEWGFGLALKGYYYLSGSPYPDLALFGFSWRQRGAVPVSSASSAPPASDKDTHCTETESGYNPGARMNYYEELGLPNMASAEEVRRAYRSLARLLHPDQQSDETLRRLAGIQMARLNEILETLTEPRLRVGYNDSLRRQAREAAAVVERMRAHRTAPGELQVPFSNGRRWSWFAWPGAGMLGIGLIALFLAQDAAVQRPTGDGGGNVPAGEQLERGSGAWPVRTEGQLTMRSRKAEGTVGGSD